MNLVAYHVCEQILKVIICTYGQLLYKHKLKNFKLLKTKFLRKVLKAPWSMKIKQIHNDTAYHTKLINIDNPTV